MVLARSYAIWLIRRRSGCSIRAAGEKLGQEVYVAARAIRRIDSLHARLGDAGLRQFILASAANKHGETLAYVSSLTGWSQEELGDCRRGKQALVLSKSFAIWMLVKAGNSLSIAGRELGRSHSAAHRAALRIDELLKTLGSRERLKDYIEKRGRKAQKSQWRRSTTCTSYASTMPAV
jgi:hypothetical protein